MLHLSTAAKDHAEGVVPNGEASVTSKEPAASLDPASARAHHDSGSRTVSPRGEAPDSAQPEPDQSIHAQPTTHVWILDVQGMHCQKCNMRVSQTLQEVKGVAKVVIDNPQRPSTPVLVTAAQPLTRSEVEAAIESAGFRCSHIPDVQQ